MVDGKPIMEQVQEMVQIAQEIAALGEPISKNFQVSTIIGKLPASWKDYRKVLKHKRGSQTLEALFQHLQIEEQAQVRDKLEEDQDRVNDPNLTSNKVHAINPSNNFHGSKMAFKKKKNGNVKFGKIFNKGNSSKPIYFFLKRCLLCLWKK